TELNKIREKLVKYKIPEGSIADQSREKIAKRIGNLVNVKASSQKEHEALTKIRNKVIAAYNIGNISEIKTLHKTIEDFEKKMLTGDKYNYLADAKQTESDVTSEYNNVFLKNYKELKKESINLVEKNEIPVSLPNKKQSIELQEKEAEQQDRQTKQSIDINKKEQQQSFTPSNIEEDKKEKDRQYEAEILAEKLLTPSPPISLPPSPPTTSEDKHDILIEEEEEDLKQEQHIAIYTNTTPPQESDREEEEDERSTDGSFVIDEFPDDISVGLEHQDEPKSSVAENAIDIFEYRKKELGLKITNQILSEKIETDDGSKVARKSYQPLYFYYDDEQLQRYYLWADNNVVNRVELSRQLAYILGFKQISLHNNEIEKNTFAKYTPDITGGLHSFYVYAPNLIANTIIGNTYGPLLRIVNVSGSDNRAGNKVIETIYTQ
ncbi:MAG TPA: hypothetical protein VFV08_12815, partial [Puia sp.]|nr:hypothetical protein [Puia sp.]